MKKELIEAIRELEKAATSREYYKHLDMEMYGRYAGRVEQAAMEVEDCWAKIHELLNKSYLCVANGTTTSTSTSTTITTSTFPIPYGD